VICVRDFHNPSAGRLLASSAVESAELPFHDESAAFGRPKSLLRRCSLRCGDLSTQDAEEGRVSPTPPRSH
jgi:hypothetical protein